MEDNLNLHSFSIPVDSVTLSKADSSEDGDWVIEGLASTNSLDYQNEVVLVKGLDLSYLDSGRGTLNWNHRGDSDPSSVVGIITESRRTPDNELYIKGKLLKSLPKARHVQQLLKALESDCPERKMGMSIEGKVLSRNGNQIVKAWVKAVALTLDPVNKETWVSFAKAVSTYEWKAEDISIDQAEKLEQTNVIPLAKGIVPQSHECANCGSTKDLDAVKLGEESGKAYGAPYCAGCRKLGETHGYDNIDTCENCNSAFSSEKLKNGYCPKCEGKLNLSKSLAPMEHCAFCSTPYKQSYHVRHIGTCDTCGKENIPVHENDYGDVHCKNCHENHMENEAERAHEREISRYHGGGAPYGINEEHQAAGKERRQLRFGKALIATLNPNHLHSDNPLLPESLDSRLRDLGYVHGNKHSFSAKKKRKKKRKAGLGEKINKSYSYHEAIARLKELSPTLSDKLATKIVDFTLKRLGER